MAVEPKLEDLFPAPTFPVTEPWEVSIGELARRSGKVPKLAVKALGLLDRFGAVRIGPDEIGFDDEDVAWDKVVELRTRRLSDLITGSALDHEVERISGYLPPIPGRKWAIEKVIELLMAVAIATNPDIKVVADVLDGVDRAMAEEPTAGPDAGGRADGRVVAEIVYRGWVRKGRELRAGFFAAAALSQIPGADTCLRRMAELKGIPVVDAEDGRHLEEAQERGEAIRERLDALGSVVRRLAARRSGTNDRGDPDGEVRELSPGGDDTAAVGDAGSSTVTGKELTS